MRLVCGVGCVTYGLDYPWNLGTCSRLRSRRLHDLAVQRRGRSTGCCKSFCLKHGGLKSVCSILPFHGQSFSRGGGSGSRRRPQRRLRYKIRRRTRAPTHTRNTVLPSKLLSLGYSILWEPGFGTEKGISTTDAVGRTRCWQGCRLRCRADVKQQGIDGGYFNSRGGWWCGA